MSVSAGGQSNPVQVAVIGAGSFGRNHLRVYSALEQATEGVHLTACVDPSDAVRHTVAAEFVIPVFATVEDLLSSRIPLDAASICTPTVSHAHAALPLLHAGIDLLIEKPLAPSLAEADEVLMAAKQLKCIVQVGHLERFNPAVTAAMPLRNRPMFFEAHRLSVFTPRSLDVDVVLDLLIHDLDIVLTLAASTVREVRAVGLPVLSQRTDIANVRIEFDSGAVANVTASRVSTERVRKLRFFQPHQYLSLDFARQDLLMIDVTAAASLTPAQMQALFGDARDEAHSSAEIEAHLASLRVRRSQEELSTDSMSQDVSDLTSDAIQSSAVQPHPSTGLSLRKIVTQPGEPLRLEIKSFIEAVQTRGTPLVSGEDGRAALALALHINQAIAEHAQRAGLRFL